MDFSEFEMLDRPVFMQFDHPGTLQPLFQQRKADDGTVEIMKDEDGVEQPIMDPVGVNLFGVDSEQFQKRRREILDARLAKAQVGNTKIKAVETEQEGDKTIVACIHSFVNVEFDGAPLTDRNKFSAFLSKHRWAREQIDRGIADRSRFLGASRKP